VTTRRLVLHFFLLSMLSSPLLFAIDNLKLNSKLDYTSDSLDGPLITGDDAQSGFVPGKPNYVIIYGEGCFNSKRQAQRTMTLAEFGTAREVCAKATGFNDGDLDAERCHFARKHLGEAFYTPLRRRIRPTSRRANPSANR